MPKLADTMTEGTVVKWLIKEGDKVSTGDEVAEVETDKATMGMETFDSGTVHKILVPAGQKVPCGTPSALILTKGEVAPADGSMPVVAGPKATGSAAAASPAAAAAPVAAKSASPVESGARIKEIGRAHV